MSDILGEYLFRDMLSAWQEADFDKKCKIDASHDYADDDDWDEE